MNRFERECQVSPSLFRRTRDQLGRVDPLAVRAARARYQAACARRGVTPPAAPAAPFGNTIRAMAADEWRKILWWMMAISPLTSAPAPAAATPEERAEVDHVAMGPYLRRRAIGFTHDEALVISESVGQMGRAAGQRSAPMEHWAMSSEWSAIKQIIAARMGNPGASWARVPTSCPRYVVG